MAQFRTEADIGNRALQRCGASRMGTSGFSENSKNASEVAFCYGKLREAELRRNVWTFACRRTLLRAIDTNTMLLVPSLWATGTTYFVGSIVADQYGNSWISTIRDNLANDPLTSTGFWDPYFGPLSVSLYDSTISYYAGELVYTAVGDGTYRVYLSLESGNEDVPGTATAYSATTTYMKNQVVTSVAIAYMSLFDLNINNTPASSPTKWTTSFVGGAGSIKWLEIGGAEFPMGVGLIPLSIVYPLGTGPASQVVTRNMFKLPAGFLRKADQNPGAGVTTWLGGPTGIMFSDWVFENGYLLASNNDVVNLRFVANVSDVSRMDPMFCEGLAARIALEVCEALTQSTAKLGAIAKIYQEWIDQAHTVNAIEQGVEQPADDDYVTCRL
jgi:hypothetical protein